MQDAAKVLLLILFITATVTATSSGSRSIVIYFNGDCQTCMRYVETLERALRSAGVKSLETYDYTNAKILRALSDLREKLKVPREFFGSVTTFVDGKYVFEGYFPVDVIVSFVDSNSTYDNLIAAQGLKPGTYRLQSDDITLECASSQKIADCIYQSRLGHMTGTWALILVSGLVDGLNPCAFAVLAYFLGVVSINRSGRSILTIGACYILSVFLVYLGIGIGLIQAILSSGLVEAVSKVFGVFVISLAVLGLKNNLQRGSGFPSNLHRTLILPVAKRFSHSWIRKSALTSALMFGGIAAALEFPCTGGIYTAIVGMLLTQGNYIAPMLYVLGYNLMFVTPLIALLILSVGVAKFTSARDVTEKRRRALRFMSELLMLGLGTLLLLQ